MTKRLLVPAAVAVLFVAGWLARPADSAQAQRQGEAAAVAQRQGWEYATLVQVERLAAFHAPGEDESADGMYKLYRELGGGAGPEAEFDISDVLTLLGADGWEMVAMKHAPQTFTFYFKRPK